MVFYNAPAFENFCPTNQVTTPVTTQAECVANGNGWTNYADSASAGYCGMNFTCQKVYMSSNDVYDRNVFVALVILGVKKVKADGCRKKLATFHALFWCLTCYLEVIIYKKVIVLPVRM
ncbi:MAG: hypothetical protein P4L61_00875 [Candidatus Pacebacteria bacterium]|nr:hypothetical protein [Candidatus Paceibacterota bacterium]